MTSISLFFVLLLLSATAATATVSYDLSALKAIKDAIDPTTIPETSCLASWNFTSNPDPCLNPLPPYFRCGLICSNDLNRIIFIFLDGGGYAGTLSPLISQLTQLQVLDLSDNKLSGPIPTSLFSLPNLERLILKNNLFSGTIPPVISILKTLKVVDLSNNLLSGSLPQTLSSNTLTHVYLSFNKFTGPIPKLPQNLRELEIKSNFLSGTLPKTSFSELIHLERVDLSDNSLTGTIPGWFFLQPFLQRVNLTNNQFTGIEILKPVSSNVLDTIEAGYNKIVGYLSTNLTAYPELWLLSLEHNKLQGPIAKKFNRMGKLKELFLEGNYLNGKPSKDFFSRKSTIVYGSFGDNCLKRCPTSSELCSKPQKPSSICQKGYGGKVKV